MANEDPGAERSDPPEWDVAASHGPRGSHAFRPGRVLVDALAWRLRSDEAGQRLARLLGADVVERADERSFRTVVVLDGVDDVARALAALRAEGIAARPDHVFFAVPGGGSVSSAPVMFGGVGGAPVMFGGVGGAPVMFGGVGGAPVMFGGVGGAPVMFGGVGGPGGCCCSHGPVLPPSPATPRRSTVRRADPPADPAPAPGGRGEACRVVVVDTGLAADGLLPAGLDVTTPSAGRDHPDADGDTQLDPAAGHATFIAGVVRRLAPAAKVEVHQVLTTFGDASDSEVAGALLGLLDDPPDVVNLSFAGYSDDDTTPPAIAEALAALLALGVVVVAAAGNDATCRPAWPAATSGVIGVGALDDHGPAWFSNHGPWVRACAPGVDVLSCFFAYPDGSSAATDPASARPAGGADNALEPDSSGWARWSGTSFAAPVVAGALAHRITDGSTPAQAVRDLVDDPDRFRLHGLGTVVNVRPW